MLLPSSLFGAEAESFELPDNNDRMKVNVNPLRFVFKSPWKPPERRKLNKVQQRDNRSIRSFLKGGEE